MRSLKAAVVLVLVAQVAHAEGLADQARANVRDVLSRPEFQPLADADRLPSLPDFDRSWIESLVQVLWEMFSDLFGGIWSGLGKLLRQLLSGIQSLFSGLSGAGVGEGAGVFGTAVAWSLVVGAAALLVWLLLRLMRASSAERRAGVLALGVSEAGAGDDDALARTPEDWRRRAERLAAGGDRVEAIRALYLELLAGLHRAGAIDYDRTRTNTAYVFDLAHGHPARPPFVALTHRFDRAVYGAHEPTETELATAMREVDTVRSELVRGSAVAAPSTGEGRRAR